MASTWLVPKSKLRRCLGDGLYPITTFGFVFVSRIVTASSPPSLGILQWVRAAWDPSGLGGQGLLFLPMGSDLPNCYPALCL